MTNLSPFIRIGLRIFGGFMIGNGYAAEDDMWIFSDPELVGALALMLSEGWYFLSRRLGWAK